MKTAAFFIVTTVTLAAVMACDQRPPRTCVKWDHQTVMVEWPSGKQELDERFICHKWEDELVEKAKP
jgi:hypothetical protein